jgi:hypothetical protein
MNVERLHYHLTSLSLKRSLEAMELSVSGEMVESIGAVNRVMMIDM